jgi:hypothetical protein
VYKGKKGETMPMTRKQALSGAIALLGAHREIAEKLQEMLGEYPSPHWVEAKILDAFEQWIEENGRAPSATVIDQSPDLPSHSIIMRRFGLSARAFLSAYFPDAARRAYIHGCGYDTPEGWARVFRGEFIRIRASSGTDYNARRAKGTPRYNAVMRLLNLSSWAELASALELPRHPRDRGRAPRAKQPLRAEWTSPAKKKRLEARALRDGYAKMYPEVYRREPLTSE